MIPKSFPGRQGLESWAGLAAIFYSGIASAALLTIKPLIVGALIDDYGFSAAQAGSIAGVEMAGIGVASLLIGALGPRWPRRSVIAAGAALALAGSFVPLIAHSYVPVLVLRFVAGFGSGLIAGSILATLGTSRDPDRMFGIYLMSAYVFAVLLFPLASTVIGRWGAGGAYTLLAAIISVVLLISRTIPDACVQQLSRSDVLPPVPRLEAGCSLAVSVAFWIGNGAVWAFVERLGLKGGATSMQIAAVLSFSQVAFMAGAAVASALHTRLGRTLPLVSAMVITIIGLMLIGWGHGAPIFTAGVTIFCFAWPLFLAYLNGTMATQDPAGRIVALGVTSQTVGMAIGPIVAGILANRLGYAAVVAMALTSYSVAIALLVPLAVASRGMHTAGIASSAGAK